MTARKLEELAGTSTNLNGRERWGHVFAQPRGRDRFLSILGTDGASVISCWRGASIPIPALGKLREERGPLFVGDPGVIKILGHRSLNRDSARG